ncbi:hypothetical protein D3C87_146040 [compost metagenome]
MFLALNIVMIVTGSLPDRSAVGEHIMRVIFPYQSFFGLDQMWSMFAPNPGSMNSYIDAQLLFKDGSIEKYTFPRPTQMDSMTKFLAGERFRKYSQENMLPLQRPEMWFDLSAYVAREVDKIEAKGRRRVLDQIQFSKHTNFVQPPDKVFIPHGQLSTQYTAEVVFNYKPADKKVRYEATNSR